MTGSRTKYAARNFFWSTVGNVSTAILTLILRTVFIRVLGTTYLGVSGLFTNILGMLSLAELGFGTAISFSLYKPLADKDEGKVWAIIYLYRNVYRIVALVVTVVGVAIIPFLKVIVKGADGIDHITLYYCIYLFNSVSSYLITYRTTVLNADQKSYLLTNINTITKIITAICQIIALFVVRSFIAYLIVESVILLIEKVYLNYFTKKRYPYLKNETGQQLSKDEKQIIFRKVRALVAHKIGEVSIYQTDSILTSALISVNTVGLVSNFTLIINYVNKYITSFFAACVAGLGNVNATETKEKKYGIFKRYDFLGFFAFSVTSVTLYFTLSPLVGFLWGAENIIGSTTVLLLCANFYFVGQRIAVGNMKDSAGVFEPDAWMSIAESIVNIVVSIIAAKKLGLPGIYIGTIVSGMIPTFGKPYIMYKYVLGRKSLEYYIEYFKRLAIIAVDIFVVGQLLNIIRPENMLLQVIINAVISMGFSLLMIFVLYRKSEGLTFVLSTLKRFSTKILNSIRMKKNG